MTFIECFFSNSGAQTAFFFKAQNCAREPFNEGGFSLLLSLCSHNKTVTGENNSEPCVSHELRILLLSPQARGSGCHCVPGTVSHTRHTAFQLQTHTSEYNVCTLHICVHVCVSDLRMCVCKNRRAAHTSVQRFHSGNNLLSQNNPILIAAVKDSTTGSLTGSEFQSVPEDLLDM